MKWSTLFVLPVALLVPWIQAKIDARLGTFRSQEEALYLWRGEQVKRFFPGMETLAADIYWLRTVQYFGGQRLFERGKQFGILRPLIDITTTLDPRLEVAYRYGAIFLSEPPPTGAGRPEEGVQVLKAGTLANPQSWRLRQDLGFFHYLFLGDAQTASQVLTEAAEIPGAAFWLKTLAADILAEGGERELSRHMWQQMRAQSEEGVIRANADLRLQILNALDTADALVARVASFEQEHGRKPESLAALVPAFWKGPIVDPTGVPFEYTPEDGRVGISRQSTLWRPKKGWK